MKVESLSIVAFLILVALVWSASPDSMEARSVHIEKRAMASLGYQVVNHTRPYPADQYAMPQPYSSEALVVYSYKGISTQEGKGHEYNLASITNDF